MIKLEKIGDNALKISIPEKLNADDFHQITPEIDALIQQHGQIRLLLDATAFNGWENLSAFETHASFIKNHQKKIERLAVIAGHQWQHWLIATLRIFVHPDARAYDKNEEADALRWITG